MSGKHPLSSNQVEVKWELLVCVLVFYVTWILFQAVRQRDMLGLRRLTSKLFSSSQTADNNTTSTDKTTQNASDKPPPLRREKTLPVSNSAPQTSVSRSDSTSQLSELSEISSESPKERTKTIKRRAPQPLRQSQSSSVLTSCVGSKAGVKNVAGKSSENINHVKRKAPQPVKQSQSSSALSSQDAPSASEFEEALKLTSKVDTQSDVKIITQNENIKQTTLFEENEPIIPQTVVNFEENPPNDVNTNLNGKTISGAAASPQNKTTINDEKTTEKINKNPSPAGVNKKSNESQNITKKAIKSESTDNKAKNSNTVLHDEIKHVFQFQLNQSKSQIDLKKKTDPPPCTFPTVLSEIVTPVNGSNNNGANATVPHITQEVSLGATTRIDKCDTTQVKTEDVLTDACEIIRANDTKQELLVSTSTLTTSLEKCSDSSVKIKTHIDSLPQYSCANDETDNSKTGLIISTVAVTNGRNNLENQIESVQNKIVTQQNEEISKTKNVDKSDNNEREKEIKLDNSVEATSPNKLNKVDHNVKNATGAAHATKLENFDDKQLVNDVEKSINDRPVYLFPVNVGNNEIQAAEVAVKLLDKISNSVDYNAQNVAKPEIATEPEKFDINKLSEENKKSCNDHASEPTLCINDESEIKTAEVVVQVKSPDKILTGNDVNSVSEADIASKLEKIDTKKCCDEGEKSCNNQAPINEGCKIETATVTGQVKSADKIWIHHDIQSGSQNAADPEKSSSTKLVTDKKLFGNYLTPVNEGNEIETAESTDNSPVKILKGAVNILDIHETTSEKTIELENHHNNTKKSGENKESCNFSLEQVNVVSHLNTAKVTIEIKSPAKILDDVNNLEKTIEMKSPAKIMDDVNFLEKSNINPEKTSEPEKHHHDSTEKLIEDKLCKNSSEQTNDGINLKTAEVTTERKSPVKILSYGNLLETNNTNLEKTLKPVKNRHESTEKLIEDKLCNNSSEQINKGINLKTAEVTTEIKSPTQILSSVNLLKISNANPDKTLKPENHHHESTQKLIGEEVSIIEDSSEQVNEEINLKTAKENEISEISKPVERAALQATETSKIENKINSETNKSTEDTKLTEVTDIELASKSSQEISLKAEETLNEAALHTTKQEGDATIEDNHEKNNLIEITDDSTSEDKCKNGEKSDIISDVERDSVNRVVTAKPTENKQATQTIEIKTEEKITKTAPDEKKAVPTNFSTPNEPLETNGHNSKQITCIENGKNESAEVKSGSKVTKVGSKPENHVGAAMNGEKKIGSVGVGASLKSRPLIPPPVSEPVKIGFGMLKSRPKNEPIKKKKKKPADGDKKGGIFVESQISVSIVSPSSEGEGTKKKLPAVSPSKTTVVKKENRTKKLDPVVIMPQENGDLKSEQCNREPSLKPADVMLEKPNQPVSSGELKPCDITVTAISEKSINSVSSSSINASENSSNCNGNLNNEINETSTKVSPIILLPELKSCEVSEESTDKKEVTYPKEDIPLQTLAPSGVCEVVNKLDSGVLKPETIANCNILLEQEPPAGSVDNNCGLTLKDNRVQVAKELTVEVLKRATSEASISFAPISPTKENKSLDFSVTQNEKDAHFECKNQPALGEGSLNFEPSALPLDQNIVSLSPLESCHSQGNIVQYEFVKSYEVITAPTEQRSLNCEPNISTLEMDTLPPHPPNGQGFGVVRANTGRKLEDDRYRTEVEVFFRAGALQQLECQRDERLQDRVTRLQARCRGYLARRLFAKRKVQEVAVRCIQRNVRRFLSVRDWPWWRLLIRVAPLLNVHRAEEELKTKTEELETLRAKLDKVETERTRLKQDTDRLEGRLSELSVALSEEHSAATLASERLEAETAERLRLQQELEHVQTRHGELQAASERLEMELLFCRAAEMNGTTEDEGECDEGASPQLRQRLERAHRELALAKRRLTQQHEDDLEQMLGLKKTMDKKLADAYEEVEEQRQVAAQWKRKAQRITSEGNDSRLLLEEHAARNALLEKRQRKFDADLQALQEALRQEKAQKERAQRERDLAAAEKASAEQNLVGCRLELEMREEKVASLSRELEELQFGGAAEEEVAALRKARHSLELKLKEQEEELDDLAGQVSLLEQAKLRLEMSLEQQRKETRREFSQRDEELEEVRANAHKKVKALESQLEAEHEERTRLLRERHELERRLTEAAEAARGRAPEDEQALARLRRDLRHTKALLRDAHTMLDKYKNEAPGKGQIRQLRHQLEDAEAARTAALRARQVAETELRETQATLEEASRARVEAEDRAAASVRERTEARGQLEENEEEMAEVLRKYRAAVAQVSQEQAALQESAVQLQTLEAERNSLKEQLAELAVRVESAEGETVSSLTQRRLEMKVRELESRLELEQTTRTRLETQISRLKDATEKLQSEGDAARTKEAQAQEASRRLQRQLRELREAEAGHAAREADWARRRRELELRTEAADQEASTARTDLRLALQRVEDLQQAMAGELNSSASEDETEGESDSDESIESFLQQHRTPLRSTSHLTDTFELDFSCRSPEGQSDPGEPASSLVDENKTNESQA